MSSSSLPSKALAEAVAPRIVTPTHASSNSNNSNNNNSNNKSHRKPPMSPTGKPLKLSSSRLVQSLTHTNAGMSTTQIKIFVLLLQPQSKIFELIQLVYHNNTTASNTTTTIGDLLDLIPSHATEPALGSQTYTGLCRPTTSTTTSTTTTPPLEGWTDLESLADFGTGEILVGIPHGFTASQVASLSHQILTNPKIVKLLQRADPLGQSKHRKRHRHGRKSSSNTGKSSSSSRRHAKATSTTTSTRPSKIPTPLPFHPEVDESQWTVEDKMESERQMKHAMEHAAAEAAAANAACGGAATARTLRRHDSLVSQSSTTSSLQELDYADYDTTTTNGGGDNSTMDDNSFSSWSKSFDASFSGQASICSSRTVRAHRRQVRAQRRVWLLQQCALVGLAMMIAMYCLDPQHHHHHHDYPHAHYAQGHHINHDNHTMDDGRSTLWHLANEQRQAPLAWKGLLQVACLLLGLYKWQLMTMYTRKAHQWTRRGGRVSGAATQTAKRYFPTLYMSDELHACPFLQASGRAWKRFQSKYAHKLQRHAADATANASTPPPTNVVMPSSSSKPLRSFSLKAGSGGGHAHHPHEE